MSEWEQPHQNLLTCREPSVTGRHLGFINRKYFEPATWEPLLSTEVGRVQYGKFVASMAERIQSKESSYDEIRSFIRLVATEHNWNFLNAAMPHLPELKEQYPHDAKNFEMALLFMLKPEIHRRDIKEIQGAVPLSTTYDDGLSKTEEQFLRRNLFGPDRGARDSTGMGRLFKSTLELGYPQPALDQSVREANERGTDIERCRDGLPTNLHMPHAADTMSPRPDNTEAFESFLVRELESSPGSPQSSPPVSTSPDYHTPSSSVSGPLLGTYHGLADREDLQDHYGQPSSVFVKYFDAMEPAERAEWPRPDRGPAPDKPIRNLTGTEPVVIPSRV